MAEAFNTAVQRLGDRLNVEWDPLVHDAKDLAAAGVLLAACASVAIAAAALWRGVWNMAAT